MLSNNLKLYFPKLVFEKAGTISHSTTNELKPINLYKLDWTRKNTKCNKGNPELESYEDTLASLRFAISDGYLREIRRCSWRAVEEWNATRLLDASLKHIYLLPTSSYIETSFRLLSDCLYDESTSYYYRKNDKKIIPYMMLYKFWKNQVNNNLVFNFCKLSELLTLSMSENLTDGESAEIDSFIRFTAKELGEPNG